MNDGAKIFISHASKDKKLADAFVDFLVLGLNIKTNDFFCTSLEGLGIPTGENFIDFIQDRLKGCKIVISLLSPNYYESRFCLCELGASWILSRTHFPIIIPPLKFSDIEEVLKNNQMRMIDKNSDLDELSDELTIKLKLKNVRSARWGSKKDQFLKKLPKILAKLPVPDVIPSERHEELQDKYDDLLQQTETLEEEKEQQREIINELKSCKDQAEVRELEIKYSSLNERFEDLIRQGKKAIKGLPNVVVKALYYYFRDEDMPVPSPFESDKFEDIKLQMEYEYLCGSLGDDHEAGYINVCEDNPEIVTSIDTLSELRRFIGDVTDEDSDDYEEKYQPFVSNYRDENGFNLSFKSRNFWEEHLDL